MSLLTRCKNQLIELKNETDNNQRLRWGIFLVLALALFYTTLVLDDTQQELFADFGNLTLQKMELADLEPIEVWQQRVADEEQSLKHKEVVIWMAESEALIRARLQSRITHHAELTDLVSFNMRVGSFQPHGELRDVSTVRLEFDAVYEEDRVLDFISSLESNRPLLKMESMSLRVGKRNNRAKMMILAYVKSVSSSRSRSGS